MMDFRKGVTSLGGLMQRPWLPEQEPVSRESFPISDNSGNTAAGMAMSQ